MLILNCLYNILEIELVGLIGVTTTLFFWSIGDILVDWYLTFLIHLYLSFPFLYKIISNMDL